MYQVPQHIDKNRIFIVQRSEIEGRLDPKMALYNRKAQSSLYPKVRLKDLIVCKPQYGAGEPGIERKKFTDARYIRITDIDEYGLISHDDLGATANCIEDKYILNENETTLIKTPEEKSFLIRQIANGTYEAYQAGATTMSATLYNMDGKVIASNNSNGNTISINTSNANKGIYLLKVSTGKFSHTQKIVIR